MSAWRFGPPLWAWAATLPLALLLATLGAWQCQRGQDKAQLRLQLRQASTAAPVALDPTTRLADGRVLQRAQVHGVYETWRQLLLDNQTHAQVPGYRVWTPLRTGQGLLMVDRGWVAQNPDRKVSPALPAPAGMQTLDGYWRRLPEPGLRLAGTDNCPEKPRYPVIVSYPTEQDLSCLLGEPVADGVLLLDPGVGAGFVRDWEAQLVGVPPERHYAYAVQWFALCLTLLAIFIKLNLKRAS